MDNRAFINTFACNKLGYVYRNGGTAKQAYSFNYRDLIESILINDQVILCGYGMKETLENLINILSYDIVLKLIRDNVISFEFEDVCWSISELHSKHTMLYKMDIRNGNGDSIEKTIHESVDKLNVVISMNKRDKLFKEIINSKRVIHGGSIDKKRIFNLIEESLNNQNFMFKFVRHMMPGSLIPDVFMKEKMCDFDIHSNGEVWFNSLSGDCEHSKIIKMVYADIIYYLYSYFISLIISDKLQCVTYIGSDYVKNWYSELHKEKMNDKFNYMLYTLACPDVVSELKNGNIKGNDILNYRDLLSKYRNFLYENWGKANDELLHEYHVRLKEEEKSRMGFNLSTKILTMLAGETVNPAVSLLYDFLGESVIDSTMNKVGISRTIKLDDIIK